MAGKSMKTSIFLTVALVVIAAFAFEAGWQQHQARLRKAEMHRMRAVEVVIRTRLEDFHITNNTYPESLDSAFRTVTDDSNLIQEVRKFRYRRNDHGGYMLGYYSEGLEFSSASATNK